MIGSTYAVSGCGYICPPRLCPGTVSGSWGSLEKSALFHLCPTEDGTPIAGATLDVWQTASNGLYETQDPEQPDYHLRGIFTTNEAGEYEIRTVQPVSYPIPDDGPVGKLLSALGRHPYRPAHIHFLIAADGYEPLVTQVFASDDNYLNSDAVFGVKRSLVVKYEQKADGLLVEYDFGLKKAPPPSK